MLRLEAAAGRSLLTADADGAAEPTLVTEAGTTSATCPRDWTRPVTGSRSRKAECGQSVASPSPATCFVGGAVTSTGAPQSL